MMAIVGGLVGGLNYSHCGPVGGGSEYWPLWVGWGLNDGHCGWVGGGSE